MNKTPYLLTLQKLLQLHSLAQGTSITFLLSLCMWKVQHNLIPEATLVDSKVKHGGFHVQCNRHRETTISGDIRDFLSIRVGHFGALS